MSAEPNDGQGVPPAPPPPDPAPGFWWGKATLDDYLKALTALLIGFLVLTLAWFWWSRPSTPPVSEQRNEKPRNGDRGYLKMKDENYVLLASNERALEDSLRYADERDQDALRLMVLQGRLFICKPMTEVSVTDAGRLKSTVLITSGEHIGKTGIVATEWLHK